MVVENTLLRHTKSLTGFSVCHPSNLCVSFGFILSPSDSRPHAPWSSRRLPRVPSLRHRRHTKILSCRTPIVRASFRQLELRVKSLGHRKADPKIAETTWVHKIFGGKLRSRVTCDECHHNSDTFDNILDLSVDIHGVDTLRDALRKFTAIDYLRGADKYKCEKCVLRCMSSGPLLNSILISGARGVW
jgi:hypothetical protein